MTGRTTRKRSGFFFGGDSEILNLKSEIQGKTTDRHGRTQIRRGVFSRKVYPSSGGAQGAQRKEGFRVRRGGELKHEDAKFTTLKAWSTKEEGISSCSEGRVPCGRMGREIFYCSDRWRVSSADDQKGGRVFNPPLLFLVINLLSHELYIYKYLIINTLYTSS